MWQPDTLAPPDHLLISNLWSSGHELDAQNSLNNEFMTVFSHELRNSLGAGSSAARILRMETHASLVGVKARTLIEHQVTQMMRLVEDLLDVSRVRTPCNSAITT